jgi:excisionase family DNA binding protein
MKAGVLRARVAAALEAAMRTREADVIALTADRAKAVGVALAGLPEHADVIPAELAVSTRGAASVLGFHPEHVRRLIRTGRLRAERAGGDYRVRVDDLWPLLETRHRPPGRRRSGAAGGDSANGPAPDDRPMSHRADPS